MERKIQSEGPMTKEKMAEYFKTCSEKGFEKALSIYYAEDAVFENMVGEEVSGKKNIIKLLDFAHRGGTIKETLTPIRILVDGDNVAAEILMELDVLEDVPDHHFKPLKKGEKTKNRIGVFYKIRDGKIAGVKVYPPAILTPIRRA